MTILVDHQLYRLLEARKIDICPLMEGAVQSNSIDIRLGNSFAQYSAQSAYEPIDPYDEGSTLLGLERTTTDRILLGRGAFLLAETMETIQLPSDICAVLEGKSSLARLGLTVHQTGGFIDCGFRGTITLELSNENPRPIILRAGMPIAQLVFYQTDHADIPYGSKSAAKYHNQQGATPSKYFRNIHHGVH